MSNNLIELFSNVLMIFKIDVIFPSRNYDPERSFSNLSIPKNKFKSIILQEGLSESVLYRSWFIANLLSVKIKSTNTNTKENSITEVCFKHI